MHHTIHIRIIRFLAPWAIALGCNHMVHAQPTGLVTGGFAGPVPGVTASTITLGQSLYLSGPLGALGKDFSAGAQLYFDQLNAKGGVHGRQVLVETMDDAYVPDRALENARKLVEEKRVFSLFQFAGTGSVAKVAPWVDTAGVPLCAAVATGPELRAKTFKRVFYVRAGNQEEVQAILKQLAVVGRNQSLGVLYLDAPYGKEVLATLQKELVTSSTKIVAAAIPLGQDSADQIKKSVKLVAESNPQAILLVTAGKSSVAVVNELRNYPLKPGTLYGLAAAFTASELQALGQLAEGIVISQVIPNPQKPSSQLGTEFSKLARKKNIAVNFASMEGWLNAKVCSAALQKAGRNLTRASFVQALEQLNFDIGGVHIQYAPQRHGGSRFVELTMVGAGGKFMH